MTNCVIRDTLQLWFAIQWCRRCVCAWEDLSRSWSWGPVSYWPCGLMSWSLGASVLSWGFVAVLLTTLSMTLNGKNACRYWQPKSNRFNPSAHVSSTELTGFKPAWWSTLLYRYLNEMVSLSSYPAGRVLPRNMTVTANSRDNVCLNRRNGFAVPVAWMIDSLVECSKMYSNLNKKYILI